MPRIAHVLSTPAGLGGAERLVAALARDGATAGDDVLVLNAGQAPEMGSLLQDACAPVEVRSRPSTGLGGPLVLRSWVARELDGFAPDVVHAHLARASLIVSATRRRPERRRVLTHHHGLLFAESGRWLAAALDAAAGRRYDVVVAVSPAVQDALVRRLHYRRDRVRTIVNGWQGSPLVRRPASQPTLVCVGRLRPEKGHDVLVHALREVVETLPTCRLELLGDGPERASLEALASRLGVASSIVFHGDVDSVWPWLSTATAAVQPSRAETFGIGVLEAMAAQVPVVASAVGGLPELLEDGACGLLVTPGDAGALARALLELLQDQGLRTEMAAAGVRRAADFRLERTIAAYRSLYAELLATAGREAG